MTDAAEIQLPPPPQKIDGRSREAKERRRQEAQAQVPAPAQVRTEAHSPRPEEIRERPTRADGVKRERRRRENVDKTRDMKLGFRFKPDPGFEYRWINGGIDDQRIKTLTVDDDWEMVNSEGEASDGAGQAMRRAVGESKSGPQYAYLCRKPKDWYEADHRKGQERLDKMMKHIRQGKPPTDISQSLKTSDNVYGAEDIRVRENGRDVSP